MISNTINLDPAWVAVASADALRRLVVQNKERAARHYPDAVRAVNVAQEEIDRRALLQETTANATCVA